MIHHNIHSEKLEQYNYHRARLIDLCSKAEADLEKAREIQKRFEPYGTPADKLKADTYTLVLIGGFQSGKSTLFNYLCDGRELSPVGPNGGGLRTSGCMVTAHPVKEGESERAIITWRSPEELLTSLGNPLIKYYENPVSFVSLTPREVNLDKEEDRNKLAQLAIQELTNPSADLSDENMELLRFTLLVCRFYNHFEQRCKAGKSECTPDETVKLTSYPQEWEGKWYNTQEKGAWMELPNFSEEEVQFAFCGGVELFLDSPILRNIGCSIIDCPGLFISKWDTEIASRCIREANAILYMMKGEMELSQEGLTALQECIRMGGAHKIIFGANLHKTPVKWSRVLQNGVLPKLMRNGFSNPVVHNFHAAIALRTRELMYEEYGMLSQPSRAAIEYDIELEGMPSSVKDYLSKQLDVFIPMMASPAAKKLADYADNYPELEKLSGVPDFVGAASNHVLETRATSVLIHEGTRQLQASLSLAKTEMGQKIELLDSDVDNARKELKEKDDTRQEFVDDRKLSETALNDALSAAEKAIYAHYEQKINQAIDNRLVDLVAITQKIMPNTVTYYFVDKHKLCQQYLVEVGQVLSQCLEEVRKDILETFPALPAVKTLRDKFEDHRSSLMKKLKSFKQIENLAEMPLAFPADFKDSVCGMVMPRTGLVISRAIEKQGGAWNLTWTILTCGINLFLQNSRDRAEHIVNQYINDFKRNTREELKACMEQPDPAGPMKILQNTRSEFSAHFIKAEKEIEAALQTAENMLNDELDKAAIIPALQKLIATTDAQLQECQQMEADIRADLQGT